MATNHRALVVGLSLQDGNLKDVFSRAKAIHAWRWPVAPDAQPHVFCEDELGGPQRTVLEVIYGDAFDSFGSDILAHALLRARPRTALPALALHVVADKLCALAQRCVIALEPAERAEVASGVEHLRDMTAAAAPADRKQLAAFLSTVIAGWSRGLTLFRKGEVPEPGAHAYCSISPSRKSAMMMDQNVGLSGLDEAAAALGLIGRLVSTDQAIIGPATGPASNGAMEVTAIYAGARRRKLILIGSTEAALCLATAGVLDNNDAIIVHSGTAYMRTALRSARSPRGGRARPGATHVSIRQLMDEGPDLAMLEQRFLEEAKF